MPSIDERIVAMAFENAKFEAGVAQTMATLQKLDASLAQIGKNNSMGDIEKSADKVTLQAPMSALDKLKSRLTGAGDGAAQGLGNIEKAGDKVTLEQPVKAINKVQSSVGQVGANAATSFNEIEKSADHVTLAGLTKALDSVTGKFSVMQGAASVAIGNITSQAAMKGGNFAKSFALGPVTQGLQEYGTNLNSIQTILSNTADSGGNLKSVNAALGELNTYSDKTIYNFSEMAKNIGTFTAAGVQLKPATAAIKGIANLAALSGSNSQQASTAMYQLSQAIAAGKVGLQDWNSVVNAGMGGAVFQKALMRTAENMGALKQGAVQIDKATGKATVNGNSFRESIMAKPGQQSWLTSDVLTKTLSQFTGDMSDAQLASQGFNAEQIKSIQNQAKLAQDAATQVKTLPQVFDVARETIGSGWAQTFQLLLGDFGQAKKTFTGLSNFINGIINRSSKARNDLLKAFDALGGRDKLIQAISGAFHNLMQVIQIVSRAFRTLFPPTTADGLIHIVDGFRAFDMIVDAFLQRNGKNLQSTFQGFFAVLHIGWTIVKDLIGVIGHLFGVVGQGSGGFLAITGSIGNFLTALDKALTQGGLLKTFFGGLSGVLSVPIKLLGHLATIIFGLFGGVDGSKADVLSGSMDKVSKAAGPLTPILNNLKKAWDGFMHILDQAQAVAGPWLDKIASVMSTIGTTISNAISNLDFNQVLGTLQTSLLAGIFLAIKKAISGGSGKLSGALGGLNKIFGQLTNNLKAMEQQVRAKAIFEIAAAIGVLAASTYVLSTIDPKRLASALAAMAIGLGQLMGAIKLMTSGMGKTGVALLPVLGAGLVLVATSTVVLAGAMKIFATMKWEDIAKGLVGVGGGLAAMGLGLKAISGPQLLVQGPGLILVATGLNILALAVKQFAGLKWGDLGKGIAGMAGALVAIAIPLQTLGPELVLIGPGLIAVGIAMGTFAGAVATFSTLDPRKMVQGIVGLMGAIAGLGAAIQLIPPTVALQAAGLVVLSVALAGIATAIGILGNMNVGTLVKGIAAIGGALVVLAGGLSIMSGTMAGSVALLAAAGALAILAPTLGFLGTLNWGTIFKGLAAMALTLGTLAVVGEVASGGLISLGISLLPLAGVFVVTAGGVFLFAKALALLGDSGAKGIGVMVTALTAFIALLPNLVIQFVKGLVETLGMIAELAPKIVLALGQILDTVIAFVIQNAGKFAVAIGSLIDAAVVVLATNAPKLIQAGYQLLLDLLTGLDQHISEITSRGASIIAQFLKSITDKAPALAAAGVKLIVSILNGVASQISKLVGAAVNLITSFVGAIYGQIPKVLLAGVQVVVNLISGIFSKLGSLASAGLKMILQIVTGIANGLPKIVTAAADVIVRFVDALSKESVRVADAGAKALIRFMHGIAGAIRENEPALISAGGDIADAIVDGLIQGLEQLAPKAIGKITGLMGALPKAAKKILGIHSPSTVFAEIGTNIVDGVAVGLDSMDSVLYSGITDPIQRMLKTNKDLGAMGKFLGNEFRDGLSGGLFGDATSQSTKTIEGAFQGLTDKLHEGQQKLHDTVKADRDALQQELDKEPKDQDPKLIAKLSGNLAAHRTLLSEATAATTKLVKDLRSTKSELIGLGGDYEAVSKKLEEATSVLQAATQARDDAKKSLTSQYDTTPDISTVASDALAKAQMTPEERAAAAAKAASEAATQSKIDEVAAYKKSIQDQIDATNKYATTLQALRALGLDDATYQKLLAEGTKGQQFASQLLATGQAGVTELNNMDSALLTSATTLANDASKNLYQAGVDAATGLVKGLQDQQSEIRKTMEAIAESMVHALKKKLKIKSPSQVFMEMGQYSAEGMVVGLQNGTSNVASAASDLGDTAISSLQSTMSKVGDSFSGSVDMNPTITPVLDLTNVRRGVKEINGVGDLPVFATAYSNGMATSISSSVQDQSTADSSPTGSTPSVTFQQNNYSPESLSSSDIYRQTQNQLSQVKSGLGFVTAAVYSKVG